MEEEDIENALKGRLGNNLTGLPSSVAWPNQDFDDDPPYLEVQFSGGFSNNTRLKGGGPGERVNGVMNVMVVTQQGVSTGAGNNYAGIVKSLFPMGLSLSITGGSVNILQPPSIRKGFEDDGNLWKVPVIVQYEAKAS